MKYSNVIAYKDCEFGKIRIILIKGEPWFIAKDIAKILKFTKPSDAIREYTLTQDRMTVTYDMLDGELLGATIIDKDALYSLVFFSKWLHAYDFREWVDHTVMPRVMREDKWSNMENLVKVENEQVVTDSRSIAENFGKQHKDVLKAIENIKAQNCAVTSMFYETSYRAGTGKSYKMYLMNRDGFSLLVMGFTGAKALEWKLKYIAAFNNMEKLLSTHVSDSYLIADPIERAKAWIKEQEEKKKVLAELEATKPLANETQKFIDHSHLIGFRELAKELNVKEVDLNKQLIAHDWKYKVGKKYKYRKQCVSKGYMETKDSMNEDTGWSGTCDRFTIKGRMEIEKWFKEGRVE